jgi:biotin carboxylase
MTLSEEKKKNIILYIMALPGGTLEAVREYEKISGESVRVMLLRDSKVRDVNDLLITPGLDIALACDFSSPTKIAEALLPYQNQLLAVSCRQEQALARFAQVIPHVPYLRTPTTESLEWASDKYKMRLRFNAIDKKLNPKFTRVKDNSKSERARVIKKVGFPMVVKPASMVASLYVTICYHEAEFEKAVRNISRRLNAAYKKDNRLEVPKIIAEEHMEGSQYSVDSYVNSRGGVTHCPLVQQKTAKEIGHDDFYTYLQTTPTALKKSSIDAAESAAASAIRSLGLRSTITHTELMKIDDEWKIIEVGARMGGFRHVLHKLSCGINHTLNDILVRIPKKPIVPKKCAGYACAMKWFAEKEGAITELRGIKKIEELDSFHSIVVNKKVGDRSVFARNGGRSVFNLLMKNEDRSKLLADIRRVEQMVEVKVAARGAAKKLAVTKKTVKKVIKKKG